MTEILASSIVAVSGDLGGNTVVAYFADGDYWEKRFSPGETFHVVAQTVDPPADAERDVLLAERDAALLEIERLQGVVLDLQERCGWEQRRADDAEGALRDWEIEAAAKTRPLQERARWAG